MLRNKPLPTPVLADFPAYDYNAEQRIFDPDANLSHCISAKYMSLSIVELLKNGGNFK